MHDPLIRKQLPPDWIDLAVGEAHLVRRAFVHNYGWHRIPGMRLLECDYQSPSGYPPLVELLEKRHGQRVCVTAGAKQALSAIFYAVKKMGMTGVVMRTPFWSQMPATIELAGLQVVLGNEPQPGMAYLLVSPNNPDGHVTSIEEAIWLQTRCDELKVPLIHDAAYHTDVYVPDAPFALARTVLYSSSKMYGLSGLRAGWLATDDADIHASVCDYIETSTVGVALPSQQFLCTILQEEARMPEFKKGFVADAQMALAHARFIVSRLEPDILDVTTIVPCGMFGWYKMGPKFDPDKARVHVAPGYAFGDPTYVRMNLAVDLVVLEDAVNRLQA